jgi:hypothetical protein
MKGTLIFSAITALVAAQGVANLPVCSFHCLSTAFSGLGCAAADFSCSCQKADQLTPIVTPCVQTACRNHADQRTTIEALSSICAAAGFPIKVPEVPSSSATSEPTPEPTTSEASVETQPSATDEPGYSEYSTPTATFTASEYSGMTPLASLYCCHSNITSSFPLNFRRPKPPLILF